MKTIWRAARIALPAFFVLATPAAAQDLVPGGYTPGPVGYNVVNVAGAFSAGGLSFDPTLPVEDAKAKLGIGSVAYGRSLGLFGRYANVLAVLPYVNGHVQGLLLGNHEERWLSGLGDVSVRVGVNLFGARAMTAKEFAAYRAKRIIAVSLTVGVPVGQYDSDRFINIGRNRWAFKPEIGLSTTHGRWTFEGDAAFSVFTDNHNYVGGKTLEQAPIGAVQGHVIYTIRFGYWIAADANFWRGGRLTTNGVDAAEQMRNSRAGVTLALPLFRRQIRIAYSFGAYTTLGGDFHTVGASYSYAWK